MNELQLYIDRAAARPRGLQDDPRRPATTHFYASFCPAPGHQLGFNDIKTIEVRALVTALAGGPPFHARLPRGLGNPARRRRHRPLGQGAAVAEGGGGVGNGE